LLVTAGLITYVKANPSVNAHVKQMFGLAIAALIISFVIQIALICCRSVSRSVPLNFILLGIFTITEAFTFAYITTFYDAVSCIIAAGLTAGVTVVLTLYAIFTKTDFTVCGQMMWVITTVAIMLSLFTMFLSVNNVMHTLLAGVFVIIYGLYLIFDT
jgi:FtsH-binding integral membrane protein